VTKTPQISAIICTHNRASLLPGAVRSLYGQSLAAAHFEVVIVNNASRDRTPQVVTRLLDSKPEGLAVRAIHEPVLGLSHARNAGLAVAKGEYVAFLDDDAIANPGWLVGLGKAFAHSSRIATVVGQVRPIWPLRPPTWLDDSLGIYYSILDYGNTMREINTGKDPLAGANIGFRHAALTKIGGFAANLGRQGTNLLSSEETDAAQKLARHGYQTWYAPDASVDHHIHANRLTRRWILTRAFWQGVSNVAMSQPDISPAAYTHTQKRVNVLLLRALGKDCFRDYVRHDLLHRNTRMRKLIARAIQLGEDCARSLR
jgi:glycosyltransferase involved in cell wall biosynthesis